MRTLVKRRNIIGWCFILPAALLIFSMSFYPTIRAFTLSLTSGVGDASKFVGIANYQRLPKDNLFKMSLFNTLFYLVMQVPIMLTLSLILASLLNSKTLKFKGFFRTAIFLPCATSLVSAALIFQSLFAGDGFINAILSNMNIINTPINWFGNPWTARFIIILAITWRWTGYNMIFYLAGLQNIDPQIYEAARIDGANLKQQFLKITIPLLKPIILLTTIMSTNGTLQIFDEPRNITQGGPANATLSISQYIYKLSFDGAPKFGYAAAISFVIVFIVAILALIQMKVGDKRD